MSSILCAAGGVIVVLALGRLALWADDRGWIAVRRRHRRRGLGVGMMSIAQIYAPSIEHVIDEVYSAQTRAEQDESGEGGNRARDHEETDPETPDLSPGDG
jgi:hypothetical protein